MEENVKEYIRLVEGLDALSNELVVTGGLAQYYYLGKLHRKMMDVDLLLEPSFSLKLNLKMLNGLLNTDYEISSIKRKKDGFAVKLVSTEKLKSKTKRVPHFTSMDVKYKKELYTRLASGLRILKFEQLLSNKVAASLIGDNTTHYLRVKDLYDLYFLLDIEGYDQELFFDILGKRLKSNQITSIFRTYLFYPESQEVYTRYFEQMREHYGMNEEIELFKVKQFLYQNADKINNRLW